MPRLDTRVRLSQSLVASRSFVNCSESVSMLLRSHEVQERTLLNARRLGIRVLHNVAQGDVLDIRRHISADGEGGISVGEGGGGEGDGGGFIYIQ